MLDNVNKGTNVSLELKSAFPHSLAELLCAISMRLCYEMAIAAPIFPGHGHRFARMTRDIGSTPAKQRGLVTAQPELLNPIRV